MRCLVLRIAVASLLLLANSAWAQTFQVSQDTWLNQQNTNSNYGNDSRLDVDFRSGRQRRAMLQFDLSSIPTGTLISQAVLRIRVTNRDSSGGDVGVFRITDNWTESGATWSNASSDYDASTSYASFSPSSNGYVYLDITPLVQAWVCGDFDNDGLMLVATSGNDRSDFASGEFGSSQFRPSLTVTTGGTGGCGPPPAPQIIADWQMDDCSVGVSGTTVVDNGPNGLDGNSIGGVTVEASGQLCAATSFNGTNGYVNVPDDSLLDVTDGFSVAVWVRHDGAPLTDWEAIIAKGDSAFRLHLNGGCEISDNLPGNTRHGFTLGLNGGCSSADLNSNVVPLADTWYHVAATYDRSTLSIYINGNLVNTASYTAAINTNGLAVGIGENTQQRGRYWSGDIDELTIWDDAISAQDVVQHRDRTRPCTGCGSVGFQLNHDNYGIHCLAENVQVDVIDALAGTPRNDYDAQITLDTQTGRGSWALVSGGGTLTDATGDDGLATYDWPLGETTATFALSYTNGAPSVDVDVYQTSDSSIADNDAEGAIEFSASGFTLTSVPLSNPVAGPVVPFSAVQTAGTDFPVYIAAYGQTPNDAECGIIESYTGNRNLAFWFGHQDPASGALTATIDGSAIATAEGAATNQAVTFINGQATVTGRYKDVGRVQVSVKDDSQTHPDLPTGIRGATGGFVVRPFSFVLSNIEDGGGSANPGAAGSGGPVFIAAGEAFSATVTAIDAEGSTTPNYGQESVPEGVVLTSLLVAPAAGQNPPLGAADAFGPFAAGSATGNNFSWPEVGVIQLTPSVADGNYLGAGDVVGDVSANVGRFVPAHFTVNLNSPLLSTTCVAGGFTYIGQEFGYSVSPVATLTARALAGQVTTNYSGAFFKLENASMPPPVYSAIPATLDTSGLPAAGTDPSIVDSGNGVATLSYSSGTGLSFLRSAEEPPFDADITLSSVVVDSDGIAAIGNPLAFSSIAFSGGANMRYGRAAFANAYGSELVNLGLPLTTQYWVDSATGYANNTDDACTTGVTVSLGGFTNNLSSSDTCVLDTGAPGVSGAGCAAPGPAALQYRQPMLGGNANLHLAAPGAGNDGSVNATADVPPWLEYDWDPGSAGNEDPQGTAVFGIYGNDGRRIYLREIY